MRDSRAGECLWREWTGEGYDVTKSEALVFYTNEHVDLDHDIVRRALASALQRDGSAVSLGNGFGAIESSTNSYGYAGEVEGDIDYTVCDESGETAYGDYVETIIPITWVEI